MAKLGQVYLDNGEWQGRAIVSRDWIDAALAPSIERPPPRLASHVTSSGYGFHWWHDTHEWQGGSIVLHSAIGNGGQRIVVSPRFGLVVAIFGGFYQDPNGGQVARTIVRECILAAVQDSA
jgi:CubicO group peptidase (beta-lactamase class C family)